jgi:5-methylcytosine-specific restriction endonuclease McrA
MKTDLVSRRGAKNGDVLIGRGRVYANMKIRIFSAQKKGDNYQIEGGFDLLEAGTGKYAAAMDEFVGRHFENAPELVELVRQKTGDSTCTYLLHKDMLRFETPTGPLTHTEFPEGKEIERRHKARERNQGLIRLAKEIFRREHDGQLYCEVCEFSFHSEYGQLGRDYIEGHHLIPLSEPSRKTKTKIEDIALVCSNCHRMLDRRRPWLGRSELKKLLQKQT